MRIMNINSLHLLLCFSIVSVSVYYKEYLYISVQNIQINLDTQTHVITYAFFHSFIHFFLHSIPFSPLRFQSTSPSLLCASSLCSIQKKKTKQPKVTRKKNRWAWWTLMFFFIGFYCGNAYRIDKKKNK